MESVLERVFLEGTGQRGMRETREKGREGLFGLG